MAFSYQMLNKIREDSSSNDRMISNIKALGLPADTDALHILWMYPDILNVFGSRGDLMALMRVGCAMGIPTEIKRINSLSDDIDFERADIIYYPAGDLTVMENIMKNNSKIADQFHAYADRGRMIIAVSSSGAILADEYVKSDGTTVEGLGLLHMTMTERTSVHGDDIWFRTGDGAELIGNQIQLLDVWLHAGTDPLGEVIYGRGNNGDGGEGAISGGVIYTACLGPAMVRNPWYAANILRKAAQTAGIIGKTESYEMPDDEMTQERQSFEEAREFIKTKM